jgi:L-xylulose reductase
VGEREALHLLEVEKTLGKTLHNKISMFNLSGKKILVTGAGRGIGRQLVKTLSEEGCVVYALNRSKEPLDTLVAECKKVIPIQADIGNWDEIREKLRDLEPLDGLVNNAACTDTDDSSALDTSKEYIHKVIGVNLVGTINITQIIGKKMVEANKTGSIVNVSSVLSLQAIPGYMMYTVTKAAVDMVTKQFALELGPHNIRVNVVNPTITMTELLKDFFATETGRPLERAFLDKTPMGRAAEMSEVVYPILYLLSDCSSMVSGTQHIIDGGMMSAFATKLT